MLAFELKSQKEIDENYQGINITEFDFSDSVNFSEDELVENFIHSKSFTEESRREIVKNDTENRPFLRQAFVADLIGVKDFKQLNKKGVLSYLDDYANRDDWESDRDDFVKIKDKFSESLMSVESDKFYSLKYAGQNHAL